MIRTTACGALPGVVTGIIDLSGRLYTLAGGWLAVVARVVALTIDLSGRLYTLAAGWLAVVVGVVLLIVAAAVGAPAAASDRMTAAVVVCGGCCHLDLPPVVGRSQVAIGAAGRLRGAGREVVETGLEPVDTASAGFSEGLSGGSVRA